MIVKAGLRKTMQSRFSKYRLFAAMLIVVCSAAGMGAGCSGHYLRNRARDAGDIFTVEAQTRAYGASVRMGPVKAGAYYKGARGRAYGLRGGYFGAQNTAEFTALLFGADYHTALPLKDLLPSPEKAGNKSKNKVGNKAGDKTGNKTVNPLDPAALLNKEKGQDPLIAEIIRRASQAKTESGAGGAGRSQTGKGTAKKKRRRVTGPALLDARRKQFRAYSPLGTKASVAKYRSLLKEKKKIKKSRFVTGHYFTQFEFSVGLFGGLKIGFNPGELLDFFLGFFTIDIYGDDAPYPDPLLKRLRSSPAWKQLDEKTRRRIIRDLSR